MRRVRVRWTSAAKAAAIAVGALVALQTLPALLKPPAPPPLAPDVGLPQPVVRDAEPELHQQIHPAEVEVDAVRRRGLERPRGRTGVGPATVVSRSGRRLHRRRRHPQPMRAPAPTPAAPTPTAPAPEPATYVPPPTPVPVAPAPEPAPSAPAPVGDGSEEFAPR